MKVITFLPNLNSVSYLYQIHMPNPLPIIVKHAEKGQLSEKERLALQQMQSRQKRYSMLGQIVGGGLGFYLFRKNKSMFWRFVMVVGNAYLIHSLATTYSSVTGLRALANSQEYPHIAAAIKDVSSEFMRSRGVDPKHPELGRTGFPQHKPDFNKLPPPMTQEESNSLTTENRNSSFAGFGSDSSTSTSYEQKQEFGNPSLPGYQDMASDNDRADSDDTDQKNAWASSSGKSYSSNENAWDKIRRQNAQQRNSSSQGSSHGDNVWNANTSSGGKKSEGFPRTREDFAEDGGASSSSNDGYNGSSATSFST